MVRAEGQALGAVATWVDAEPYGEGPQTWLKTARLPAPTLQGMREAIRTAVRTAGQVDFVEPVGCGAPTCYAWTISGLGKIRGTTSTYYSHAPQYRVPKLDPPPGIEFRLELWGCNVGLNRPEDRVGDSVKLTIDEVKTLDLDQVRKSYPECAGFWVYVDSDIFPQVIRQWGR
mgnify:CR=1 FL=1